ncbi:hypothetical protein [Nannocystis pusilla]|uniref:hypothetical protein n=1 Tax=Nannocystis pusilla TaxID=889268 RepID=UPI003B7BCD9C
MSRQLNKKLQVAAGLAQRLRQAQQEPQSPAPSVVVNPQGAAGVKEEFDRAREVLGLVLSALTRALDDDDEAVAELGRRLRHHAGGKLLHSITRGSLTLVPLDGRYLVDRAWLERLDLTALRGELDVAAQSGIYPRPTGSSIVHTEPRSAAPTCRPASPSSTRRRSRPRPVRRRSPSPASSRSTSSTKSTTRTPTCRRRRRCPRRS